MSLPTRILMEILTYGTHTIVTEVIRKPSFYYTATTPSDPIFFDKIQLFYYVQLSINKITDTHRHVAILYNFLPVSVQSRSRCDHCTASLPRYNQHSNYKPKPYKYDCPFSEQILGWLLLLVLNLVTVSDCIGFAVCLRWDGIFGFHEQSQNYHGRLLFTWLCWTMLFGILIGDRLLNPTARANTFLYKFEVTYEVGQIAK